MNKEAVFSIWVITANKEGIPAWAFMLHFYIKEEKDD